ncbi:uncharacterized protein IAS62_004730 [Cryptococcus decagattii]|uniref:Uncharacterized protein n=1 Tax=Cryptococcus decagattii TaxID=1859122 RepID=A0ABZ2AY73_9TREE
MVILSEITLHRDQCQLAESSGVSLMSLVFAKQPSLESVTGHLSMSFAEPNSYSKPGQPSNALCQEKKPMRYKSVTLSPISLFQDRTNSQGIQEQVKQCAVTGCLSGLSFNCRESTNANQVLHFHLNSRSSACIDHGESVKFEPVSVFFLPSFLSLLCCVPTLSSTRSSTFFCWDVHSLLAIAFFIPILPLISDRIPTMLFSTTLLLTLAHFPQFRIRYTLSHRVFHTTAFFIGSSALPIHATEIVRQAELHSHDVCLSVHPQSRNP